MELQIALDRIPLARAVEVTSAVARHVDWIEVGTSLVKQYGMDGVRAIVTVAAATPVLADLKTADDAAYEFGMAYDAGAASATVLGLADSSSIDTAVRAAKERGREVVVDLMGLTDERRCALAERLPSEVVLAAHVGKDAQGGGMRPTDLLGSWTAGRRVALAGGLTADDLRGLADTDVRAIVGSAVTKAADPTAAVRELLAAAGRTVAAR